MQQEMQNMWNKYEKQYNFHEFEYFSYTPDLFFIFIWYFPKSLIKPWPWDVPLVNGPSLANRPVWRDVPEDAVCEINNWPVYFATGILAASALLFVFCTLLLVGLILYLAVQLLHEMRDFPSWFFPARQMLFLIKETTNETQLGELRLMEIRVA